MSLNKGVEYWLARDALRSFVADIGVDVPSQKTVDDTFMQHVTLNEMLIQNIESIKPAAKWASLYNTYVGPSNNFAAESYLHVSRIGKDPTLAVFQNVLTWLLTLPYERQREAIDSKSKLFVIVIEGLRDGISKDHIATLSHLVVNFGSAFFAILAKNGNLSLLPSIDKLFNTLMTALCDICSELDAQYYGIADAALDTLIECQDKLPEYVRSEMEIEDLVDVADDQRNAGTTTTNIDSLFRLVLAANQPQSLWRLMKFYAHYLHSIRRSDARSEIRSLTSPSYAEGYRRCESFINALSADDESDNIKSSMRVAIQIYTEDKKNDEASGDVSAMGRFSTTHPLQVNRVNAVLVDWTRSAPTDVDYLVSFVYNICRTVDSLDKHVQTIGTPVSVPSLPIVAPVLKPVVKFTPIGGRTSPPPSLPPVVVVAGGPSAVSPVPPSVSDIGGGPPPPPPFGAPPPPPPSGGEGTHPSTATSKPMSKAEFKAFLAAQKPVTPGKHKKLLAGQTAEEAAIPLPVGTFDSDYGKELPAELLALFETQSKVASKAAEASNPSGVSDETAESETAAAAPKKKSPRLLFEEGDAGDKAFKNAMGYIKCLDETEFYTKTFVNGDTLSFSSLGALMPLIPIRFDPDEYAFSKDDQNLARLLGWCDKWKECNDLMKELREKEFSFDVVTIKSFESALVNVEECTDFDILIKLTKSVLVFLGDTRKLTGLAELEEALPLIIKNLKVSNMVAQAYIIDLKQSGRPPVQCPLNKTLSAVNKEKIKNTTTEFIPDPQKALETHLANMRQFHGVLVAKGIAFAGKFEELLEKFAKDEGENLDKVLNLNKRCSSICAKLGLSEKMFDGDKKECFKTVFNIKTIVVKAYGAMFRTVVPIESSVGKKSSGGSSKLPTTTLGTRDKLLSQVTQGFTLKKTQQSVAGET